MSKQYAPPFTINTAIIKLVADIAQLIGSISVSEGAGRAIQLHRTNRIKTIHGSLAIEGNTLNESQITAILEGKRVIAPIRDIQEVRNAIKAYDIIETLDPYSIEDLLSCHRILMTALLDTPGRFRTAGVGVMKGKKVIHMAPSADRVPYQIRDLLCWLKTTDHHPLIASSVFHYEFEFIHPFDDGNGRMGRLWQTLILYKWKSLFLNLPVESLIHEHQTQYYNAINNSSLHADSAVFIEFILQNIYNALKFLQTPEVAPHVTPEVKKLLAVLKGEMGRSEIQKKLGLKDQKHFRNAYLRPAISEGFIEMTRPDKPRSRLQKYRKTRG